MPVPLIAAVAASAGMDVLSGLFGYLGSEDAAGVAESRGRMIRMEAEADAQRYAEQAQGFKATQKLAYLKSGVDLSGSPLDILDETARTARENLSAMRARGEADAFAMDQEAFSIRSKGRAALIGGLFGAGKTVAMGAYTASSNQKTATTPRNATT